MRISPVFTVLTANLFFSGAAFAAFTPYRAIVGIETLGLSNATFALVMLLNALGGAATAVALGWLSDRIGDRRWLVLLSAIVGGLGFAAIWAFRTPIAYIAAFCLLIPFGNALFSQSFAFSRAYYDRTDPGRSEIMMSFLRSTFTVAWVVVPPVAGWIAAETSSFSVFGLAAAAHLGSTILIGLLFTQADAKVGVPTQKRPGADAFALPRARVEPSYRIGIVGVTLVRIALQINLTVLPLIILRDLGGSLADVGINAAVAALIEVPCMIAWGYLTLRMRKELILAINCGVLALYSGLLALAGSVAQVLLLQGLAAIAIAALMSITISYLQEVIKGRVGLSTSLLDVTQVLSVAGASAIFALNPSGQYGPLMAIAAILSLGAGMLLMVALKKAGDETASVSQAG